jgi:hypothetical protein
MATLRFRMFGTDNQIDTMITSLHGMDEIDRIEEVADQIHDMRDDSSSANLHDEKGADFHNIEARTRGKSVENVRDLIEITARDINAAVEFVEQF